jgi:ABC-type Fe3+-hydroxamate transport system substrate-binding protein
MGDAIEYEAPTRRDIVKHGGMAAAAGLLAGCTGTPPGSNGGSGDGGASPTDTDESYTATLSPVGEVILEEPPTDVFTHFPWFADMATALGHGESVNSLWWDGTAAALEYFTAGMDGVEIPWADRAGEYGFTKEQLYQLDSDLHLVDPAWVSTQDNWSQDDIDEVADNVGPWFGNYYSSYHASPPDAWADGYEYNTLWDLFDGVASLYGERSRYEALEAVHEDLLGTVEEGLPPESDRPTVAYLSISTDLSAIYVLRLNASGYWNTHTRPLGATDAFGDEQWEGGFKQIDTETLVDADPDAILALWTVTESVDFEQMERNLRDDPVASEVTAVQNDRVYVQGTRWQGPLMNLFQTEMTAKQLYPERFGEWPGYENGDTYPEFGAEEQLFDHGHVADIIEGEI